GLSLRLNASWRKRPSSWLSGMLTLSSAAIVGAKSTVSAWHSWPEMLASSLGLVLGSVLTGSYGASGHFTEGSSGPFSTGYESSCPVTPATESTLLNATCLTIELGPLMIVATERLSGPPGEPK